MRNIEGIDWVEVNENRMEFMDSLECAVGIQVEDRKGKRFLIGDFDERGTDGGCGCCSNSLGFIVRARRLVSLDEL